MYGMPHAIHTLLIAAIYFFLENKLYGDIFSEIGLIQWLDSSLFPQRSHVSAVEPL